MGTVRVAVVQAASVMFDREGTVAKAHDHGPFVDEEEFVGVVVFVPDEFALELDDLDDIVVDLGGDAGAPVFVDGGEGLGEFIVLMGTVAAAVLQPRHLRPREDGVTARRVHRRLGGRDSERHRARRPSPRRWARDLG